MGRNFYVGFICLYLAVLTGFSRAIEVEESVDIEVVENGTVNAVVLDCPYTLGEEDDGLLIKWYHMSNPAAVYQWIAGHEPQALGILADRVDLAYKVAEEDNHKHRALRILNPTTELSGEYTCKIASYDDEKTIKRQLVVYSKPANVKVWAKAEGEDSVKVVCEVEDVYPEPEVSFHMTAEGDDKRRPLDRPQITPSSNGGLYSSKAVLVVKEDSLDGPTHFGCKVTIPHTEVEVIDKTHYEPRVHEHAGAVMSGSETRSALAVGVSLVFLALWRI